MDTFAAFDSKLPLGDGASLGIPPLGASMPEIQLADASFTSIAHPTHQANSGTMNNFELTGVYALKPPTSPGFPANFEMSVIDCDNFPDNFKRAWVSFSLGKMKGFMALEKVQPGPRFRRSSSPSPESKRKKQTGVDEDDTDQYNTDEADANKINTDEIDANKINTDQGEVEKYGTNKPSKTEQGISVSSDEGMVGKPYIWTHDFRPGDVLVFTWRSAVHGRAPPGKIVHGNAPDYARFLGKTPENFHQRVIDAQRAAQMRHHAQTHALAMSVPIPVPRPIPGAYGDVQPARRIRWIQGECRMTLKDFNNVELLWYSDGEESSFQGQRIIGRLNEVKGKKSMDLKDGHGYSLEDYEYR